MVQHTNGFPQHNIPSDQKGRDWIKAFAKAIWSDYSENGSRNIFFHARNDYEKQKNYAQGNQPVNKYKPQLGIDMQSNDSWLSVDWSVIPIVPKFRRIALGKLNKIDYNITATPIDSLANDETQEYFAKAKAKIMLREAAAQLDPSMLQLPALQLEQGQPEDSEELEMQTNYTYKHQMAIEAEQGIKLIFSQNEMDKARALVKACLFDYGVGGYKEYIDSNGAVKIRVVNPANIIINRCSSASFKDRWYVGEVMEMTIADLKQLAGKQFSEAEYEQILRSYSGLNGNPTFPGNYQMNARNWDKTKIRVLDLEFFSINEVVYEDRESRLGNPVFAKARHDDYNVVKDKYKRAYYKVVYKCKWIIDTEQVFDAGLCTDMKRAQSSLMDTDLSYHLEATDYHEGLAISKIHQMIPVADMLQIAYYKLQNTINIARPKGISIEMEALENLPLGKGGANLTPLQVLELYNATGNLVFRRTNDAGQSTNYRPIDELNNGIGSDAAFYWSHIQNCIQLLRDISGLNELTDASTPDPRTLTTVAKLAADGTNNALHDIVMADKNLLESVAYAVVLRLQDVIQKGDVKGYIPSLGSGTQRFFKLNPNISLHEFGIVLEERATEEQKMSLLQELQQYKAAGLLEPEDDIMIRNTQNLKVAEQLLAFRVKRRKREMEEKSARLQQQNTEAQIQSGQAADQGKLALLQAEYNLKTESEIAIELTKRETILLKLEKEKELEAMRGGAKIDAQKVAKGQPVDSERMKEPLLTEMPAQQPETAPVPMA